MPVFPTDGKQHDGKRVYIVNPYYSQFELLRNSPTCYTFFVTAKSIFMAVSWSFLGKFELPIRMFSAEVKQDDALPSCFSFHSKHPFCSLLKCHIFFMTLLLKMVHNNKSKVLSSVSKHRKAVMCITEKICVLDKLFIQT